MTFNDLTELLLERAGRTPERTAFVFQGARGSPPDRLSDAGVARRAAGVAALLRAEGVRPRRNVVVALPAGPGFVGAFFGCILAGNVPVPCAPPGNPRHETRFPALLASAGAAAVLADPAALSRVKPATGAAAAPAGEPRRAGTGGRSFPTPRWIGLSWETLLPSGERFLSRPPPPCDTAFIQFSSGSTRDPRGAVVKHSNVAANVRSILRTFRPRRRTVTVSWLPLHHDMGLLGMLLAPFAGGITAHFLSPADFARDPLLWLEAISGRGDVISGGPDFAYDRCAARAAASPERVGRLELGGWSTAFVGAEPVSKDTLGRFAAAFAPMGFDPAAFRPCYGLAESTLLVSFAAGLGLDPGTGAVSCGPPAPGVRVAISDPRTGTTLPEGREGEIRVSGPSVAAGYYRRRAATREAFAAGLPGRRGAWLKTEDLGFLRGGELFVTGRIKDVLIVRGRKHHPADIERSAMEAMAGRALGVAAFPCRTSGGEGVAVALELPGDLVRNESARNEAARAVRAALCLEHGVLPARILTGRPGFLPRTTSGKVRRFRCRERWPEGDAENARVLEAGASSPDLRRSSMGEWTPAERLIRDILARLTGIAPSSPEDNLFELGLDSLALLALASELSDHGVDLPVEELAGSPTAGALAARLDACLDWRAEDSLDPPLGSAGETWGGSGASAPSASDPPAETFSLTPSQARFLPPFAPENGTNLLACLSLPSGASLETVDAALRCLTARHDSLRLRVRAGPCGAHRQFIAPLEKNALLWSAGAAAGDSQTGLRFADRWQDLARSVDPAEGPVVRGMLRNGDANEGPALLLCIHHLCVDLVSGAILFREFAEALFRFMSGRPSPETRRRPGFADYLSHLEEHPPGGRGDVGEEGGAGHPRFQAMPPAIPANMPGDVRWVYLSEARTRTLLKGVFPSRGWRPDLALAWCTAWAVSRETGNDRVCVRIYHHHRDAPEVPLPFRRAVGMLAGHEDLWPDIRSGDALDRFLGGDTVPLRTAQNWAVARHAPHDRTDPDPPLTVLFNHLGDARVLFPDSRGVRLRKILVRGEGSRLGWSTGWAAGAQVEDGRLHLQVSAPGGGNAPPLAGAVLARVQRLLDALLFVDRSPV